jgi:hypothetical protein
MQVPTGYGYELLAISERHMQVVSPVALPSVTM